MRVMWSLLCLAVGCLHVVAVHAEGYPDRPVRLIVPYPAGGGTDIAARWIAQQLGTRFKYQIIVDNRGGANGNLGTDLIAKAAPDGYTLGMGTPGPVTVARSLYATLPYDPLKDLAPIILANESPIVLVANPNLSAKTLGELVALAKASPGKLTAALVSTGSVPHLVTEMFKESANIDFLDVPYKGGGPAAIDVIGGQVDMFFSVLPLVLPHIKAGKLRAVAVAGTKRSELIPDIPTFAEAGYRDVVGSAWNGIVAPAGTPAAVILKINADIANVLASAETKEAFAALGMEAVGGSSSSYAKFLDAETAKWKAVIKAAHIQQE
jgi:tripartite-type tricarboxylate transporter receptor subunit TctC